MKRTEYHIVTIQKRGFKQGEYYIETKTKVTDCNLVVFLAAERKLGRETVILYSKEITASEYEYFYTNID